MKVWSTKYALTQGIKEVEAWSTSSASMLACKTSGSEVRQYLHGEGKEWHRTREAAVSRAEELRAAKIASLRKQIAKLEAMRF